MNSTVPKTATSAGQPGWLNPLAARSRLQRDHHDEHSCANIIGGLLAVEDVLLDLDPRNNAELFQAIGHHMETRHGLSGEGVTAALSHRERIGSTALGQGVAIPHARIQGLARIQLAYVHLKQPISFEAPDSLPVSDFLVLLVPKQATEEHLAILAEATQVFADRELRERLRQCRSPHEVKEIFDTRRHAAS